jgi:hydroxyethylthiazole kinase-like uncharacterized protein yjeF
VVRAAYSAEQIRAAEQPLLDSLPDGTLMQRASFALARRCAALLGTTYGARVVVLSGSGGNGGDAMYAGARLAARGARVDVLLLSDQPFAPALAAAHAAGARVTAAGSAHDGELLSVADLVIDGMVGIGATGALREPMARIVDLLAETAAVVVAVDVPSGVDASTGAVAGAAVNADVTVSFGGLKAGLLIDPGAERAGLVDLVDIGLALPSASITALDADDVAALLPTPAGESDKYSRGVLGVIAGSGRYPGAAQLVVGGALAAGAGMVRYAGVAAVADRVRARWPEALATDIAPGDAAAALDIGRVQAWAVGSGLGTDQDAAKLVQAVLATDLPVLIDADAISVVAEHRDWLLGRSSPTLLTPHAGEFARLMDVQRTDVEAHRLDQVRRAAASLGATVLLKGSTTLVASPDGEVQINTAALPYLATAGSGDVLSGVCGALLAGGCRASDAGAAGAFIHGLAGLIASGEPTAPITAMDIADHVQPALRAVRD